MIISNLNVKSKNNTSIISVDIKSEYTENKKLWFALDSNLGDSFFDIESYDAFLIGVLFLAMQNGENINIYGKCSQKLLFNLENYVIPLIRLYSPSSKKINIEVKGTNTKNFNNHGVATGFSGGVDSFHTIYNHYELSKCDDFRINTLLFFNAGSHRSGFGKVTTNETQNKLFIRRYNYLKAYPDQVGLPFIKINSNLSDFHPWGHQKTHTLSSVSSALILQKYLKKYYYASSGTYSDIYNKGNSYKEFDIGIFCDPILLPLLSTESLEFISDGHQTSRIEKTIQISNYYYAQKYLNVCIESEELSTDNCSLCLKCARTIFTLKCAGIFSPFKDLFDIELFEKKAEYLFKCRIKLLSHRDLFSEQNIKFAKDNGIRIPYYIEALIVYGLYKIKNNKMKYLLKGFFKLFK